MDRLRKISFKEGMLLVSIISILGINITYLFLLHGINTYWGSTDWIYYNYPIDDPNHHEFVMYGISIFFLISFTVQLIGSIIALFKYCENS